MGRAFFRLQTCMLKMERKRILRVTIFLILLGHKILYAKYSLVETGVLWKIFVSFYQSPNMTDFCTV